ncbi:MAG: hydroxysqualene dehydroxylase HpnE [Planctomycetaceae bacterium]|nr:hydroxysqualene dehydroxylase HpnE [Planctomycetaceae bacterium]
MSVERIVAVVGGGVAGIAAAVRAAEAGWRVELIETRTKLGGRATSFVDARSGLELDNCQHVVMGCCTNILDLYDRLGVLGEIDWHETLWFARGGGAMDRLAIAPVLPAPLHYAPSFLRMRLFSLAEKLAISRAFLAILRMGPKGRVRWQGRAFGDFLAELRQPTRVVELFWDPVVVSACNLPSAACEAAHALKVFDEGMLAHRFAGAVGVSRVPLARLYDATAEIVARTGGALHLRTSAKALAFDGTRITGVVCEDGVAPAHAVIAAVPPDRLSRLCSGTLRAADKRLANLERFGFSSILGVHLALRRRVLEVPNLALAGRATHWLFAHDAPEGADCVQRIEAVVSASDGWIGLSEDDIEARVAADIAWAVPGFTRADILWSRPVLERRATFASRPGIDAIRPRAAPEAGDLGGGVANLFLAGEWTDTGWPSTMEGAARSGYSAAAACVGGAAACSDLPVGSLVRLARGLA